MDRANSLDRLLKSLDKDIYENDTINIEIHIDAQPLTNNIDVKTKAIAESFNWKFGNKSIVFNHVNFGLVKQWFKKIENDIPLLILEDDLILSEKYYIIIKKSLEFLKKSKKNNIFGLTLQTMSAILNNKNCPFFEPLKCVQKYVPLNSVFFLPQFGTWTSVVFREKWNDLVDFYELSLKTEIIHCIPGAISNKWYDSSGTFVQYFMYLKGYFFMYFHLKKKLVHNFEEKGLHFDIYSKKEKFSLFKESEKLIDMNLLYFFDHAFDILKNKNFTAPQSINHMDRKEKCYVDFRTEKNLMFVFE